jgi:hypothetical protein
MDRILAARRDRFHRVIVLIALAVVVSGCRTRSATEPSDLDDAARLEPAAPPIATGSWYRPGLGVTWHWQLTGQIQTSHPAEIYDVDLFETPAATIATLHSLGRKVLCYFSAGSLEEGRPDAGKFPSAAVGRPLDGYPRERWLDVRRQDVLDLMAARLDLAASRGCDGVEPDNMTAYRNNSGFPLTATDQLAFNRHLANRAHLKNLTVALKNAGDLVQELVAYFDLELNEECHAYSECDQLQPFIAAGKPVLNAEYAADGAAANRLAGSVCPQAVARGLRTLILPLDLDGSFRVSCF